jgi:hypothetical protein
MTGPKSALLAEPESGAAKSGIPLPYELKVFLLLSSVLTFASFTYSLICRSLGAGLPASFPYYYVPGDMFNDFFLFHEKFSHWGTPQFFRHEPWDGGYFMYPAPLAHVFHLLLRAPHPRTLFAFLMLVVIAILALAFLRILIREGLSFPASAAFVAVTLILSYPLIFVLQRWNIEILLWLVSSIAVWSFFNGRTALASSFAGLAASLKFYPLIFLGLLLPRRKYAAFALGVAVFIFITLLSLYGIGPTIGQAAKWDNEQIAAFGKYFVGSVWALGYDHSFYGLFKAFTLHWHPDYIVWAHRYTVSMAILCAALYFLRIWRLPFPNQILFLSILSVTLAPMSYDYTLLNLYPAFAMLVVLSLRMERGAPRVPYLTTYMVLFALIFTPESYVIFRAVRYGAQVRSICLVVMLLMALTSPIPFEESRAANSPRA